MNESQLLSEYAAALRFSDLRPAETEKVKQVVYDVIGVSLGAEASGTAAIWRRYCETQRRVGTSTMWNSAFSTADAETAARYNGAMAHLLDMDDVYPAGMIHLAGLTVPIALALGQETHASGQTVLTAIAVGYEIGARIAEAIPPKTAYVFHTTGTVGTIAAGITAGKILGLNARQMESCFANSTSQSAGYWQFAENNSMTKTLHNAHAAMSGLTAARLAAEGFTGATSALEGKRAFFAGMGIDSQKQSIIQGLGEALRINGTAIKQYACGRQTHSAVDAVAALLQDHPIDTRSIIGITDATTTATDAIAGHTELTNEYKHKFSLPYCIAAYLVYGNLSDAVFHGDYITNDEVQRLLSLVRVVPSKEMDELRAADSDMLPHEITIELADGTLLKSENRYIKGDQKNPLEWNALQNKFNLLTADSPSPEKTDRLINLCQRIDGMTDINSLFT